VIRAGYHAELDELRGAARDGKTWIARFQAQEITRTGINSLKVGFNQVFGYYIEITNATRPGCRPTTSASRRSRTPSAYVTPDLKEYEEKILGAEERSRQLEYELFVPCATGSRRKTARLLGHGGS